MTTCNERDRRADLFVEHLKLIVEILSASTAAYDRGAKFVAYRKIAALQEFVLIDVDTRRIEIYRRQPNNEWLLHNYAGEPSCRLASVDLSLLMETVFKDVDTAPAHITEER